MPTPKTLVRWTDDEKAMLLRRAIELMRADHGLGVVSAILEAQVQLLDKSRHRPSLGDFKSEPWIDVPDDVIQSRTGKGKASATMLARAKAAREGAVPGGAPKPVIPMTKLAAELPELGPLREAPGKGDQMRWGPSEQEHVLRWTALCVHYGVEKHVNRAIFWAQQRALPAHRQRDVVHAGTVRVFQQGLPRELGIIKRTERKLIDRLMAEQQSAPAPRQVFEFIAEQPAPAAAPPAAPEPAPEPTPVAAQQPPAPATRSALETLLNSGRQVLTAYLADILHDAVQQAIGRVVAELPAQFAPLAREVASAVVPKPTIEAVAPVLTPHVEPPRPRHNPEAFSGPKLNLPKVLVVGGNEATHAILRDRMGHKLEMRFHAQEESAGALKQRIGSADVVLVTKWVSHAFEAVARKRAELVIFVDGGVESILDRLQVIATTPMEQMAKRLHVPLAQHTNNASMAH